MPVVSAQGAGLKYMDKIKMRRYTDWHQKNAMASRILLYESQEMTTITRTVASLIIPGHNTDISHFKIIFYSLDRSNKVGSIFFFHFASYAIYPIYFLSFSFRFRISKCFHASGYFVNWAQTSSRAATVLGEM